MSKKNLHQKRNQSIRKNQSFSTDFVPATPSLGNLGENLAPSDQTGTSEVSEIPAIPSEVSRKSREKLVVNPEHYAYVARDLRFILLLASLMFATLIVLHFVPSIGG
jgi:hypothetical protein